MSFDLPSSAHRPSSSTHRARAIVLAITAAVALILSCFSHRWFVPRGGASDEGFSLLSYEDCYRARCDRSWNKEVIDRLNGVPFGHDRHMATTAFAALGIVAFGCTVFAIGALLAGAGLALLRRRLTPPVAPTVVAMIALAITVIAVIGMAVTKPRLPDGLLDFDVGYAFWLYAAGVVAGVAGALMLDRHLRMDEAEVDLPRATIVSG